jgi:hypothetical protein
VAEVVLDVPGQELPFLFEEQDDSQEGDQAAGEDQRGRLVRWQGEREAGGDQAVEVGVVFPGRGVDEGR